MNDVPENLPPDSSSQSAADAQPADADDAAWQEVEAVLASPTESGSAADEKARSPLPPQGFGPNSPLPMVETAFLASAASLIWLINFYFPLGPVLRVFFPIPIAIVYLRWGSRAAWMGCTASGLLLSVLMGPLRSLMFVMPFGLMGVLLGVLWRRRANWATSIALASLLGAIGFFFRIWLVSLLLGDDLWSYATTQVTDLLEWVFVKLGLLIQPSLWVVQVTVVGLVQISNIVYLFVVHLVALFLLDRLGNPIPRPPKWVQTLMDYE